MIKKYIGKYFVIFILGTLLMLFIKFFRMDADLNNLFTVKTLDTVNNSINKEEVTIKDLQQRIADEEKKIEDATNDRNNYLIKTNDLQRQIEELKILCGNTDVSGPGVTIRIADNITDENLSYNDKIVHDLDVRLIVNDLNNSGAEAIAINGKRIVNTTEIICSGPVISVNGEIVAAPFFIKAIGDPDKLMEAITAETSYAYYIKNDYGIDITAMKNYQIVISGKTGDIKLKYAEFIDKDNTTED